MIPALIVAISVATVIASLAYALHLADEADKIGD